MNHRFLSRSVALLLSLVLCLSLLGGLSASAANEIWIEAPTGWRNWGHVNYKTVTSGGKTYVINWGVRGETALFLSKYALDYYPEKSWGLDMAADYAGGSSQTDASQSPLYAELHSFLTGKQTYETNYQGTRDLYKYTDCMVSNSANISSFYSGIKLNGAWDSGATWNREHTWPNSKISGNGENDIMMLRPTSVSENSSRGNKAYGVSAGFYNPNSEAGSSGFDLRGDCARICLYVYVRWSENASQMWGADGVMESLDVLLDWMEQDPVDTWEMGRNDAVQSITGVRNCFVDYPELAWALFGRTAPESYPTPRREGYTWPPASAPAYLEARPDDPTRGSVTVMGWAVECTPADGYYASGYDIYDISGEYLLEADWPSLFRWENGRLLYFPVTEADFLVEIHFRSEQETDPCPVGLHNWQKTVLRPAALGEEGELLCVCARCGRSCTEPFFSVFEDVQPGKYYYNSVYWALFHEPRITSGIDDTHFGPGKTCTRAQVMSFLWAAMGKPEPKTAQSPFEDVKPGKYYFKAVLWAVENGVTSGTDDSHFSPGKGCTREQVVAFLWTLAGKPAPKSSESPFTDVRAGKYYYKAVLWAYENDVTGGIGDGKFGVGQTCTRGQIVTFLYKASPYLQ